MSDRETLLTLSEVRAWERRATEINSEMARLTREADELSRKLQAARLFMPPPTTNVEVDFHMPVESEAAPPPRNEAEESLSEAVIEAVRQLGGAPVPMRIRTFIAKFYPALGAKMDASPNYFYTVLLRHVQKGRLTRTGSGGYTLPNDSAQAETGAVAAPAPSQPSSQSIEAAHNGPKGNGLP